MDVDETPVSCPIKHIPLELLLRITYWLPTPDLGSMRLTCRAIEEMLYNSFANEFFSCKQFMIGLFSLQALVDISKSRLGGHVRRLQFGTDLLDSLKLHQPPRDYSRAIRWYSDQCELLSSGFHRGLLAEAIGNLDNLKDVVIRDFNSTRRSRDGPYAQWTSYGSTTARREIGMGVSMSCNALSDHSLPHYPGHLFNLLLDALGSSETHPKGIEIMTRSGSYLSDFAFALNPTRRPSVVSMLHNLEKLHLSINLDTTNDTFDPRSLANLDQCINLCRFLAHTPNLKNLRINERGFFNKGLESFLTWLARPAPLDSGSAEDGEWPAPIALLQLEELSVGHMSVEDKVLLDIVKKFAPSLKSLDLRKVCLVWSRPAHLEAQDGNTWKRFMSNLSKIPELDLRHFGVAGMVEDSHEQGTKDRPSRRRTVSFSEGRPERAYTGSDWRHFMKETIALLRVSNPPRRMGSFSHHDGEGEEDEEDEEDEDMIEDPDADADSDDNED